MIVSPLVLTAKINQVIHLSSQVELSNITISLNVDFSQHSTITAKLLYKHLVTDPKYNAVFNCTCKLSDTEISVIGKLIGEWKLPGFSGDKSYHTLEDIIIDVQVINWNSKTNNKEFTGRISGKLKLENAYFGLDILLSVQDGNDENYFAIQAVWDGNGNLFSTLGLSALSSIQIYYARIVIANANGYFIRGNEITGRFSAGLNLLVDLNITENKIFNGLKSLNYQPVKLSLHAVFLGTKFSKFEGILNNLAVSKNVYLKQVKLLIENSDDDFSIKLDSEMQLFFQNSTYNLDALIDYSYDKNTNTTIIAFDAKLNYNDRHKQLGFNIGWLRTSIYNLRIRGELKLDGINPPQGFLGASGFIYFGQYLLSAELELQFNKNVETE